VIGRPSGPRALTPQLFGKLMEKAVPLDPIGDQRINELLIQLKDEQRRRASKKQPERSQRS
jgi:hypothetical protein